MTKRRNDCSATKIVTPWSDAERAQLRRLWRSPESTIAEIAGLLGRSVGSVVTFASRQELGRRPDGLHSAWTEGRARLWSDYEKDELERLWRRPQRSTPQIAELLGRSVGSVRHMAHWLELGRRPVGTCCRRREGKIERRPWTDRECVDLARYRAMPDASMPQIAALLGRTVASVTAAVQKLQLPRRAKGCRRSAPNQPAAPAAAAAAPPPAPKRDMRRGAAPVGSCLHLTVTWAPTPP